MAVAFDEMNGSDGIVRPAYKEISGWLNEVDAEVLDRRRREAELVFRRIGITFAVYGEAEATERLIPFDVIPRVLSTCTASATSCAPASCPRNWCSRIRCSVRR